jgi:hypothetical protein
MENAVSGEERTLPLVPHCAISANSAISPVLKNNNNTTGVVLGCDRCSPWPCALS